MSHGVVISGIGLLSACGTTPQEHVTAFQSEQTPRPDVTTYAPYSIFPAAHFDFTTSVPGRSDRRQMGPWQLLGVTAAKLALDASDMSGTDALGSLFVNLAANGGAREHDVDMAVLAEMQDTPDKGSHLNKSLAKRIRPSFLLTQLSNLLAGNIAIILGVGGGARTFMGDAQAGVDALSDAVARIGAGQVDRILVGGVLDAERADLILSLAVGGMLHSGEPLPVFDPARNGLSPGTQAAFMVLESEASARARNAAPIARIAGLRSASTGDDAPENALAKCIGALPKSGRASLVVAGASGNRPATAAERATLDSTQNETRIWAIADRIGHGLEASFPFQIAMAALAVQANCADRALVTSIGDRGGVAAALLEAVQ